MDNTKGLLFHVIHGSFVDGHGVRTTVFLKGCPLRCIWCCNPEGQMGHRELKFTPAQCDGCGRCVPFCSANAIQHLRLGDDKLEILGIDRELCTNCGDCIEACFTGALDCFGRYITVDELFDIVRRDEPFYRASGGGVTIGGGEPTLQPHFTLAFIRKCKENYIHTAVDSCGYVLTEEGFKVLEEADLRLYDLKHMDPKEHLRCTGLSNEPILANLKKLGSMGKPIIIRMPVVPGYNDSVKNIQETGEFLSKLRSVERVDLIGYHEYGAIKHRQLGREYNIQIPSPTQEHLDDIKATLEGYGLVVQLGG